MDALLENPETAPLDEPTQALVRYAETLTRHPSKTGPEDIERLRSAGFSDAAIHDAAQTIGYFNYINRIAEGLGVDLEEEMPPTPPHSP